MNQHQRPRVSVFLCSECSRVCQCLMQKHEEEVIEHIGELGDSVKAKLRTHAPVVDDTLTDITEDVDEIEEDNTDKVHIGELGRNVKSELRASPYVNVVPGGPESFGKEVLNFWNDHYHKLIMVVIVLAAYWANERFNEIAAQTYSEDQTLASRQGFYKEYIKEAKALVGNYKNLPQIKSDLINSIGSKIFLEDDDKPTVLLAAGPKSAQFIYDIGEMMMRAQNSALKPNTIQVNGVGIEPQKFNATIQQALQAQVNTGLGVHVATIPDIEKLSWESVQVIDSFADPSDYKVKRVFMLLSTAELADVNVDNCEQSVLSLLNKYWTTNGATTEEVTPVFLHIAQNIVCVV
ncbi:unnamed protein product [Caenorhabditis auriculariae]|uniref:Uncharacterized protein n=1 Tax=Caenorhabditis auriculariae TaxID=2777116 RepID=A0A8S1HCT6_9PELO|nr:unnamed protein product [Caenorhabditis auriculariae]